MLIPGSPKSWWRLINKALEKDRDLRYQVASEMRADLRRLKRDSESGRGLSKTLAEVDRVPSYKTPTARRSTVTARVGWQRQHYLLATISVLLLVSGIILWLFESRPAPKPEMKQRQLTTNSFEKAVKSGAISSDGKYLAYTDAKRMYIKLIETGEIQSISPPQALKYNDVDWEIISNAWFPDSTRFLANASISPGRDCGHLTGGYQYLGGFCAGSSTP